jgi:hypothetical protein
VRVVSPALVTARDAQRLPGWILGLLSLAWLLPGLFGRDPWRNADLTAYATMLAMAEGRTDWWHPTLGGVAIDAAWLPHALGAWSIQTLGPWLGVDLAVRLPFAALLAFSLWMVWLACRGLAQGDSAQPVKLAFGGEASSDHYSAALADSAVLAMIATLGLLQLGHENTPELAQLACACAFLAGVGQSRIRTRTARGLVLLSLPMLALSGAPTVALLWGSVGAITALIASHPDTRRLAPWLVASCLLTIGLSTWQELWRWRWAMPTSLEDMARQLRLWAWFLWPVWPLALLTLWRWRRAIGRRHIAMPALALLGAWAASAAAGGNDRTLMLAVPGAAILAAFALPTLRRDIGALLDWFSVTAFTVCIALIWVMYAAMVTGWPPQPAANMARLLPGFQMRMSLTDVGLAIAATAAWLTVLRWRTGPRRLPLWKTLILPASGTAMIWVLLMTLWLPPLDYARSSRGMVTHALSLSPGATCVWGWEFSPVHSAAFEVFGGVKVHAVAQESQLGSDCSLLVSIRKPGQAALELTGWQNIGAFNPPGDRRDTVTVLRRASGD